MTYLSRMYINGNSRGGRKLLSNREAMHAAVEGSFPPGAIEGKPGRVLWRLDSSRSQHVLYVVSPEKPDMRHIVEQAGWFGQEWDVTDYGRFLQRITRGQEWSFRLAANPTKALNRGPHTRGKIIPLASISQQVEWLISRSEDHGFTINTLDGSEDQPDLVVTQKQDHVFSKNDDSAEMASSARRRKVTLRLVQFDGSLTVGNADKLRDLLINGIGRGRAYGAGLMTLRPKAQNVFTD